LRHQGATALRREEARGTWCKICILLGILTAVHVHGQQTQGLSAREALADQLDEGLLDSATATRLESLLDWPVTHPAKIPSDLLARIPAMDPDCLSRLHVLSDPLPKNLVRKLGSSCAELIEPYLRAPVPTKGNLAISSSSRLEASPAWQRALRGSQAIGPASARLGWSPDRSAPWSLRRMEFDARHWTLAAGDLPGWSEATGLWNRPLKAPPSSSFLQGSGASLNGGELSVRSGQSQVRLAGHQRDRTTAGIVGVGAFGQFLSVVTGRDSGHLWHGIALRSTADFDGVQAQLDPTLSRQGDAWNSGMRLEMKSLGSDVSWQAWGAWQRMDFPQPLAARPAATGPLKPLSGMDWSSGGFAFDQDLASWQWHTSLTASARGDGAACLLPVASAGTRLGEHSLQAELKGWSLFPGIASPRLGGSARQSLTWNLDSWTPILRLEEERDTIQWRVALSPSLAWKPRPDWESRLRLRQFLTDLDQRETALSTTLHPVRTASLMTELVLRQGSGHTSPDRWYFRMEASSRW
jgi:hypothetical protein